jgi:hypothetical protein
MPYLHLDWSDGRYSTRTLSAEEAAKCEEAGGDVAHLEDHIYEAYMRDCDRDAIWQALWRAISNEQSTRRREKELMPLEAAEREIRRLNDDLAQAKRMWSFFEGEYAKNGHKKHREEYVEHTCVYPQPGCQIDVLPEQWRESAQDILEQYRADRMEDGMKYQGCCCGHEHKLLDEAEQLKLRTAGFLVENDTESYSESE